MHWSRMTTVVWYPAPPRMQDRRVAVRPLTRPGRERRRKRQCSARPLSRNVLLNGSTSPWSHLGSPSVTTATCRPGASMVTSSSEGRCQRIDSIARLDNPIGRSYRDPGWWGASRHQGSDELAEEGPVPAPGVVHELEEGEVEGQLLLRDAAVRPQPGAQQRPDPLHGVDVHLAEAVAVLVPRVLAADVAHGLVAVARSSRWA